MALEFKITPEENAADSLNRMAHELEHRRNEPDNPFRFKGAMSWGWHTVGLLAYLRLRPAREKFDAWVQDYLAEGSPHLDIDRDARWEERQRLSFLELLDIMSEESLPSLKPEFYQGWQDRMSRCRWLRAQVQQILGKALDEKHRERLLALLAVYHRLIRLPAGVTIDAGLIKENLPALLDLIEMLIDKTAPGTSKLIPALARCRKALITE